MFLFHVQSLVLTCCCEDNISQWDSIKKTLSYLILSPHLLFSFSLFYCDSSPLRWLFSERQDIGAPSLLERSAAVGAGHLEEEIPGDPRSVLSLCSSVTLNAISPCHLKGYLNFLNAYQGERLVRRYEQEPKKNLRLQVKKLILQKKMKLTK